MKISLVTPSLNQARFLGASLASVSTQDYPNLEHVVVDGGSTDGSLELIKQHAGQLAWWCSEPDHGMYDALNKGFAHTTGEIMGWLNSDDILCPFALRAVDAIFSQFPEIKWLSSLSTSIWTPRGYCLGTATIAGYARSAFLDGCYLPGHGRQYGWIPQESTFWRRSLWDKAGGRLNSSLKLAGDFELWARFFEHTELIGTPTPLGGFRTHPSQKSRELDSYLSEAGAVLQAARTRAAHRSTAYVRNFSVRTHLAYVPGLRACAVRMLGYTGSVVSVDANDQWHLKQQKFL